MNKILGITTLLLGVTGMALAGGLAHGVPEIDAATAIGAVALLSGSFLVIRSRRRK